MDTTTLIVLGIIGFLVVAVLFEVWLKRNKTSSSLANTLGKESTYPKNDKPELGMEEIDMDAIDASARQNERHERRNWQRVKNHRNN